MKLSYELYVRHEVYRALTTLHESDHDRILATIESLAHDPFQEGNSSTRDSTGRLHFIKIIGEYALYYWPDHAEKEIRVVDLIDADSI